MVALQILVLSVQVRILVSQQIRVASPPLFVEINVVSPSRFATALKGTGKGFP